MYVHSHRLVSRVCRAQKRMRVSERDKEGWVREVNEGERRENVSTGCSAALGLAIRN